ncbi:hypothetical protein PF003_g40997 [Phytophthora fragariae]|nr:hypothetical protein PF003_g40997 [Phytophthora fragariae]
MWVEKTVVNKDVGGGESSWRQSKKRSVEEVDEDVLVTVPSFQEQHKT